jgi:hypothetical protein
MGLNLYTRKEFRTMTEEQTEQIFKLMFGQDMQEYCEELVKNNKVIKVEGVGIVISDKRFHDFKKYQSSLESRNG